MTYAHKTSSTKILVVGGDGLIGKSLVEHFKSHKVLVQYTSRRPHTGTSDYITLELNKPAALNISAEVAIICAGITDTNKCQQEPAKTRSVNVDATLQLASQLYADGAFIVFLSSSQALDSNIHSSASRSSQPTKTQYGRQKLDAEQGILALGKRASVVRATKVISCKSMMIAKWLTCLTSRQEINPLSDFVFCPISLQFMVTSLGTLAMHRPPGLFNIAGASALSYVDFVHLLAAAMGVDNSLIASKNALELNIPFFYPRTLSCLDMAATTATLGVTPQLVSTVIKDLLDEYLAESSAANHHYAPSSNHHS